MRRKLVVPLGAVVGLALFCLELQLRWGGARITNWIDDLTELAAALGAGVAGCIRAVRCRGRARWSWGLIAAGSGCWALGQAVWSYYELLQHRDTPFPSIADAGFLAFPVLALIGLLFRPAAAIYRHGRLRILLDGVLVAGSLFALTWATAFGETLSAGADSTFSLAVSLAYPIGDLLLLTVTLVVVTHARSGARLGLALLAVGFAALSIADSGFAYLTALGTFGTGNLIDAAWVAGFAILAMAAVADRGTDESAGRVAISKPALLLPYIPAGLGLAIAAYRLHSDRADDVSLGAAVIIVTALLGRQLLVLRDNRELVAVITRQAFHDDLTGLANRSLFADRLTHALDLHRRDMRELAVLFCDLDDFKLVNDGLGHAIGDRLLTRVAERLRGTLRPGDTLARLGGDEFAVLLEDGDDPLTVAERMRQVMNAPFTVDSHQLSVRASIGVAVVTPDMATPSSNEIMASADIAMYRAKKSGKNELCMYRPGMNHDDASDFVMVSALATAVHTGAISTVYQPIVSIDTGLVVGVEALTRWRFDGCDVPPSIFIPLAERHGLIAALTDHVLNAACGQLAVWMAELGLEELNVGVNVPAELLADVHFPDRVIAIMERHRIQRPNLVLEITEGALVRDPATAGDICRRLNNAGVHLSLDDFGTGYSSLTHLRTIPLRSLKIDKSFIDGVGTSEQADQLLDAVIMLAHQMGLNVVAEGIETLAQLQQVKAMKCEMGQGYLFAAPEPAEQLTGYLVANRCRSTADAQA